MATLVCNYLRFQGLNVVEGCIFQGYKLLRKYKPNILFISNATGSTLNFDICKYASTIGIKVVTLVSEGNIRDQDADQFLWGWNSDKKLYEVINLQWSLRAKKIINQHYPNLSKKIKVSGGVGFDIYKIMTFISRSDFLKKHHKNTFSKIIGVGCWDFGILYPEDSRFEITKKRLTDTEIEYLKKDGILFNNIIKEIVVKNKDILFLIKEHPGEQLGKKASAIEDLDKFENVLIIKNVEPIINCIAVSDFWIAYESTTTLEAWLMNKQTCLLNPQGGDFPRDSIYKGSPIFSTTYMLQEVIEHYYESGYIDGFIEKSNIRNLLIKDTIEFDDGLNHVRAGNQIIEIILKSNNIKKYSFPINKNVLFELIGWNLSYLLRHFGFFRWYFSCIKKFNYTQLNQNSKILYNSQLDFYRELKLSNKELKGFKCI